MTAVSGVLAGANLILGVWQLSLNHVLLGITDLVIGVLLSINAFSKSGR